jgi:hypothetical protein
MFGHYVDDLAMAISLMGIEVIFVGFTPSLTQFHLEIRFEVKTEG